MKDILYSSDCYKLSHRTAYPTGTTKIQSNWVARSDKFAKTSNGVVHYGITNFVYELQKWEEFFFGMDDVEFAHYIYDYRYMVEDILEVGYDTTHFVELRKLGYLPIKICSVTEGVLHSLQTPLVTVENTHPDFFWLVNYLETTLSASLWLPSTSATIAHEMHNILDKFYDSNYNFGFKDKEKTKQNKTTFEKERDTKRFKEEFKKENEYEYFPFAGA